MRKFYFHVIVFVCLCGIVGWLVNNSSLITKILCSLGRYGSSTFLSADEGDGDLYNASLRLEGPCLLEIDKQEGVRVGGSPEYDVSGGLTNEDYFDGDLDDLNLI